jgi:hypothetical protein
MKLWTKRGHRQIWPATCIAGLSEREQHPLDGESVTDWTNYTPGDDVLSPWVQKPSKKRAREAFDELMANIPERIDMLRALVGSDGTRLDYDRDSVQQLNDWLVSHVEADPSHPGRLRDPWYSVCTDIALYLGEFMIRESPSLHWELFMRLPSATTYLQPVIMGFRAENPKFHPNIEIDRRVSSYAHEVIARQGSVRERPPITVRGVTVDVAKISAKMREEPLRRTAFVDWVDKAAARA